MKKVDIDKLRVLVDQGYLTCQKHMDADLYIWNYTARCQYEKFWTEETTMCRGLITDQDGWIVARPFPKFFNYEELIAEGKDMPLEPFVVTKKMDGSLGILYRVDGKSFIATRGSFYSEQAKRAQFILHDKRYYDFPFDPDYTYLFEIIYPDNRIVVDYGNMEDLVLLAMVNTTTGDEVDPHMSAWPGPVVERYAWAGSINKLREVEGVANEEGFVIWFNSGLRVKMKFAEYVRLHRLLTGVNARTIWDLLRNGQSIDEMLDRVPDEFYKWVKDTANDLRLSYDEIEQEAKKVFYSIQDLPTRKEQALAIKDVKQPEQGVVFRMLDGRDYSENIWKPIKPAADRPFREDI